MLCDGGIDSIPEDWDHPRTIIQGEEAWKCRERHIPWRGLLFLFGGMAGVFFACQEICEVT